MSSNTPNANHGFSQRWFDEVWNNQREAAIDELRFPGARAFGWNFFDFTSVVQQLRGN